MNRFYFIIVVLVSSLAGCRQTQPVIIETYKNEYMQGLIELDQCQKAYLACDTNYSELWKFCITQIDSLSSIKPNKNDFWKDVYFIPTDSTAKAPMKKIVKELQKSDTVYVYKGVILPGKPQEPTIIEKTPWWAYLCLYALICMVVSNIILFLLLMKKYK